MIEYQGEPIGVPLQISEEFATYLANREIAFRKELEELVNRFSRENGSNTPDFILAEYLIDCLTSFDKAVERRSAWYKPSKEVGSSA